MFGGKQFPLFIIAILIIDLSWKCKVRRFGISIVPGVLWRFILYVIMFGGKQSTLFIIVIVIIEFSWRCKVRSQGHNTLNTVNRFEDISSAQTTGNASQPLNLGYFHIVEGISVGLHEAVEECKHQFRWDRWNCPVQAPTMLTKTSVFKATREAAYLQAISAAGIMYFVTKKCNHPNNDICGCDSNLYKRTHNHKDTNSGDSTVTWDWGGCMQNVWFGEKVSRIFLGIDNEASTDIGALKRHNELTGLKTVSRSLKVVCKCHGPTASCTMKTCWKKLPEFRKIGSHLKRKYKRAKNTKYRHVMLRTSNKVSHPRFRKISKQDLVFFETSPNYCEADNTIGYLGTKGRECKKIERGANRTSLRKWERSSCKRLCRGCGHVIGRFPKMETFDCECKFKWCCTVDCKSCQKRVWKYYCK